MQTVLNTVKGTALGIADQLTPLLKESCFRERGMLTPDEFVDCGDQLVHSCPTWSWASGDPTAVRSYLPADKQYLVTRNVPCHRRCKQLDHDVTMECVLAATGGDEEGWVDTHHYAQIHTDDRGNHASAEDAEAVEATLTTPTVCDVATTGATDRSRIEKDSDSDGDEEDEPADMEAFEEDELDLDDPGRVVLTRSSTLPPVAASSALPSASSNDTSTVLRTRTYTLNITYDNYYRTPRLWLQGFDENRQPLDVDSMYEDFSQDHAHKTITMETHPHLPGPPQASVHPCKHAETMKKLVETAECGGRQISVHKYLIIFLKFMQAIIPTIEYDFTQNIQL